MPREYFYKNLSENVAVTKQKTISMLVNVGITIIDVEVSGLAFANNSVKFGAVLNQFILQLQSAIPKNL
ncbi:MAG: hypothetical protein ACI9WC_003586 [Arenicella sp.]|jgi:hypothetical protein